MKQFGDVIYIGLSKGIVIKATKKRKWTYYDIVFEGAEQTMNDWIDNLVEYETYREDKINDWR